MCNIQLPECSTSVPSRGNYCQGGFLILLKIQGIDSTGLEERGPYRLSSALEAPRQNFQCQKVISRAILAHKHAHEG